MRLSELLSGLWRSGIIPVAFIRKASWVGSRFTLGCYVEDHSLNITENQVRKDSHNERSIFPRAKLYLDVEPIFCTVLFRLAGRGGGGSISKLTLGLRPVVQPLDPGDATVDRDFDGRGAD
jgi:hypothetical protein